MSKVTLDAVAAAKLREPGGPVEVCDENGRVIGRFRPASTGGWGPFTVEEVEAAFRQTGPGKTLEEIIREYESRGQ